MVECVGRSVRLLEDGARVLWVCAAACMGGRPDPGARPLQTVMIRLIQQWAPHTPPQRPLLQLPPPPPKRPTPLLQAAMIRLMQQEEARRMAEESGTADGG